ncbi:hypothetical protein [Mycolicibacterium aubagnense]|uniref:Uncharacterized protein n=1 Tax=Mycolicibacterium aubagnense TaxID=319707 RepID=A0ABM7IMU6_9MYCO|nr:hypothetical protein [Mycolicibacterium aubagnense]TLH48548.1 hypothetical protein C1S80_29990 [Mycolicibacterium aubagnense]BBX88018.1 hypothetical protein MAUB_58910 [Mycolicibacterium aubagnense]
MVSAAPVLSSVCAGWAVTAGFAVVTEGDAIELRPEDRNRGSYRIRSRGGGRVELFETDPDDIEVSVLFAVDIDVLEHYLVAPYVL